MSSSVFKGQILAGDISAQCQADFSNESSTLLTMSYAEKGGGNPQVRHEVAVPGGSARVGLNAPTDGMLEVWVVAGHEEDSGRLQVLHGGTQVDVDSTQGSVRWVYAVVTP